MDEKERNRECECREGRAGQPNVHELDRRGSNARSQVSPRVRRPVSQELVNVC